MRMVWGAVGMFGLGAALAWPRVPEPLAVDAPAGRFSAGRALRALAPLMGAPRVSGSPAQRAAVEGLVDRLGALGFPVARKEHGTLWNVEAGEDRGAGVWLVAHSDSARRSPGGADDGLGLAVLLEAARVLAVEGVPDGLHLLVTDGEEQGLLGAEAFVESAPAARRLVINVEARGSEGPAYMFQTAGDAAALLAAWRSAGCTAQAGSLARRVYELLPNDTDFSVFRRAGAEGYDFALIHGAWRYHTPDDTFAALDPAAVQQVGDCVVGLARAWLAGRPVGDGSALAWQQVGPVMVALPAWLVRLGGAAGLVLLAVGARGRPLLAGVLGWIGGVVLAGLSGMALLVLLVAAWPGFLSRPAEVEGAGSVYASAWALAAAAAGAARAVAARFATGGGQGFGGGWLLAGAGVSGLVAVTVPEVGLVVLPGVFAAAARLWGRGVPAGVVQLGAAGLAGALLCPVLLALPEALTSRALPVLAVVPLVVLGWLAPFGVGAREKTP